MIRRLTIPLPARGGRGHGLMDAGAQASELASPAPGLYGLQPFLIQPPRDPFDGRAASGRRNSDSL
jgi:hypothetical protein